MALLKRNCLILTIGACCLLSATTVVNCFNRDRVVRQSLSDFIRGKARIYSTLESEMSLKGAWMVIPKYDPVLAIPLSQVFTISTYQSAYNLEMHRLSKLSKPSNFEPLAIVEVDSFYHLFDSDGWNKMGLEPFLMDNGVEVRIVGNNIGFNAGNMSVSCPFSGEIEYLNNELGEFVKSGDTVLIFSPSGNLVFTAIKGMTYKN